MPPSRSPLGRSMAIRMAFTLIVGLLAAICLQAALGVAAATTTTGRCPPSEDSSSGALQTPLPVAAADRISAKGSSGSPFDYGYDNASILALTIARLAGYRSAPQTTPTTTGECDEGAELFHGTDIDAARAIVANGFSVAAAREAGGDGRFYLTEDIGAATWFARANPRDRDPAIVRASLPITVEQAVASGLLRPEPLPGAYTVANIPGFEAIARYSLIEL